MDGICNVLRSAGSCDKPSENIWTFCDDFLLSDHEWVVVVGTLAAYQSGFLTRTHHATCYNFEFMSPQRTDRTD